LKKETNKMELSSLKLKPQLIEIKIDDEDIIKQYGEAVTFYMMDHLDIQSYFDFFKYQSEGNLIELSNLMKKILVDKKSKPILSANETLPVILMSRAITAVGNQMVSDTVKKAEAKEQIKEESLPGITED